jgi:hypothetical protein
VHDDTAAVEPLGGLAMKSVGFLVLAQQRG